MSEMSMLYSLQSEARRKLSELKKEEATIPIVREMKLKKQIIKHTGHLIHLLGLKLDS